MPMFLEPYWPHVLFLLSLAFGATAAVHAAMTKEEVRSAIGWVGVIILSPIVGALLYFIAGINRIRRSAISDRRILLRHARDHFEAYDATSDMIGDAFGERFAAMKVLGDRVTEHDITTGNSIEAFVTGDDAYQAMLRSIAEAERSILLETYIFDRDRVGRRFVEALTAAIRRGVAVRVLIDAVGAR
ncbi:MAG TPA: PLDc N-terminal domain-containing protein, partial [Pseudorhizobium sp.]|nr:PLDc N-terminal domain-containing protein [Pseudorhizobium sp.]